MADREKQKVGLYRHASTRRSINCLGVVAQDALLSSEVATSTMQSELV